MCKTSPKRDCSVRWFRGLLLLLCLSRGVGCEPEAPSQLSSEIDQLNKQKLQLQHALKELPVLTEQGPSTAASVPVSDGIFPVSCPSSPSSYAVEPEWLALQTELEQFRAQIKAVRQDTLTLNQTIDKLTGQLLEEQSRANAARARFDVLQDSSGMLAMQLGVGPSVGAASSQPVIGFDLPPLIPPPVPVPVVAASMPIAGKAQAVEFSPDGQYLAVGGSGREIVICDSHNATILGKLSGWNGWINSLSFSSDGEVLASGGEDRLVRLWSVRDGKLLRTLPVQQERIWSVAFSPDGRTLAIAADQARLWTVPSGQPGVTIADQGRSKSLAVCFSPDGELLGVGGNDGIVTVHDARTGQRLQILAGHTASVWSVAFSPNSERIAAGSSDGQVLIWRARTGVCEQALKAHTARVCAVAFAPTGRMLASAGDDGKIILWDIRQGEAKVQLDAHEAWIHGLAYHPSQPILASVGWDGRLKLWNLLGTSPTTTAPVPSWRHP